jgi:drug/metabolite transporter (DMT)-like permease
VKGEYSALLGIVGGLVDILAGVGVLQPGPMMGSESSMFSAVSGWAGFFLIGLGVVVFLTGLYIVVSRMMNSSLVSSLMPAYGVIMLVLGVSMLGRVFSMMQYSAISGVAMLLLGAAMLYSGYDMRKGS